MSSARPFFSNISEPFLLVKWKVQVESHIFLSTTVLIYKNTSEGTDSDEELKLKSTVEGMILQLLVKEGDVVQPGSPLLMLKSCTHELIVKEICAHCGADLQKLFKRLPGTCLKVTPEQAEQLEIAGEQRLLKERKLALLICLDKILVDTINVQDLPSVSDHEQISEGFCTTVRPGTRQFLEAMSQYYELHFFTDGKLCYAKKMAEILDPTGKLFSQRIWTRHDCFDSESNVGNLKAIFPHGTSMVCIIDTHEDKFKNCSTNVIYVKPYNCLPLEIDPTVQNETDRCKASCVDSEEITNPTRLTDNDTAKNVHKSCDSSPLKSNVSLQESSMGELPETFNKISVDKLVHVNNKETVQTPVHCEVADALHKNSNKLIPLKAKDEKIQIKQSEDSLAKTSAETDTPSIQKELDTNNVALKNKLPGSDKKCLISSGQREEENTIMEHLKNFLVSIHKAYYNLYDQMVKQRMYIIHHKPIPELKNVIPYFRRCILKGVNIVFSGVIPTNVPKETSNLWILAKSLGANVSDELVLHDKVEGTTHIIASKLGTNKTNTAKRFSHMYIVTPDWLYKCSTCWRHVDEKPFQLNGASSECSQAVECTDLKDEAILHDVSKEKEDAEESSTAKDGDALSSDNASPLNVDDTDEAIPGCSKSCLVTALNLSPQELNDMNSEVYEECTSDEGWPCDHIAGESTPEEGVSGVDSDEDSQFSWNRKRSCNYSFEMSPSDIDSNSYSYPSKRPRYQRKCPENPHVSFWDYHSSDEDSDSSSSYSGKYGCGYVEDDDASLL